MLTRINNSNIKIDMKYATNDNFTGKILYRQSKLFLHKDAAIALNKAINIALNMGYKLKIFDGFRPTEAQQKLWNHTPDPNFLAPPEQGSPHSRGIAVDLTLIKNGNDLDMGTEFDAFTPASHHGGNVPINATHNRMILLAIMTLAGWDFYKNEWWHYQLFNSKKYPLFSDKETGIM